MSDNKTTGGMPRSDFAMLAARLAQVAATWSADTMTLPEDLSTAMDREVVERFAHDIRARVDRIVERAANG